MKKRILSLILTAALLASMIVLPADAAEPAVENLTATADTCSCGCGKTYAQIDWQPWEGNAATGHYYLEDDYVQDGERIVVAGEKVVFDLRGHTITTQGLTRLFLVNGYLAVIDTVGGGILSARTNTADTGGVIQVQDNEIPGALFELYSGTITPDPNASRGKSGGLVYVGYGATFRMYDGLLLKGRAKGYGGCIGSLEDTSNLEILGGTVLGGEADADWSSGGNIYFEGDVTLKNCKIIGGYTTGNGGNIATTGNTINIENCVISDGYADGTSTHANGVGGNIYLQTGVTLNITDSVVRNGRSASSGGNIYFGNGKNAKNFTRTQVYGGISEALGHNLFNSAGAKITLTDTTIDGGLHNSTGTVTLKGSSSIGLQKEKCPHCDAPTWYAYGSTEGNHWKLSADNAAFAGLTVANGETIVLDLAGFDLTAAGRAFNVEEGGKLIIVDSANTGIVTGSGVADEAGGVIYNAGTLQIYGGKYVYKKNSSIAVSSGGVICNAGTFNLYNGILDGSAYSNTASTSKGGALFQADGASGDLNYFTMAGGLILGGKAYDGGSIYVGYHSDTNITSGTIANGKAYHEGGNIYFVGNSSDSTYEFNITGAAILEGTTSNDGTFEGWGGNIGTCRGIMNMTECYVRGGTATRTGGTKGSYGGNIHVGVGATLNATDSIIIGGNSGTAGGNFYTSNARTKLNLTNCLVRDGEAALRGGNIQANNGTLTIKGGEVSFGTSGGTGGNIHTHIATTVQADKKGNLPKILRGTAATYGGNLYMKNGPMNLTAAYVSGGTAGTRGGDIFVEDTDTTEVIFGADFRGNIALGVAKAMFASSEIYGGAINKITTNATNASFYLDGAYNDCGTLVKENVLYLTVAAVVDATGEMRWYMSNEDAMAACGENEYVKLCTTKDLVLTKNCVVDLNGNVVNISGDYTFLGIDTSGDEYTEPKGAAVGVSVNTYDMTTAPNGNRYVAVAEGDKVTYHRLGMKITGVSIRPSADGMYYTGKWSCDDTLKGLIANYGVVASTESMPTEAFADDADNRWTAFTQETFQSGAAQNGAVISGIMKTADRTEDQNNEYGKKPVYAKAYVTFENGPTYVSDDNIKYSLYDVMKGLDGLIETTPTKYRRYTLPARNFYETWKTMGMGSWKFNRIPTPEEDGVINVLMIGNSHCYYYVEELYGLAKAAGIDMRVCNVYYSGCPLEKHYNWWQAGEANYQFFETYTDGRDGTSNATLEWCLSQYEWDVISIQEYGVHNGGAAARFEATATYHEALLPYLKAQFPNAQMLWHQTWGYQFNGDGGDYGRSDKGNVTELYTQQKDFAMLIEQAYGYQRVPSGDAWENMRNDYDYNYMCVRLGGDNWGDGYHDGEIGGGQYLNACVWFEIITGQSVLGNTYRPSYKNVAISSTITDKLHVNHDGTYYRLNEDFVTQLQNAAHKAVAELKAEQ